MLKVDKLCDLKFITVIKAYDCNSSYYKREGTLFITSELGDFECSGLYRTNSYKSCKIHGLASGFLAQQGVQKFVTYLLREVDGRVISEMYFLDKN